MTLKTLTSGLLAAAVSFGAAHATTYTINAGGSSLAAPTYIAEFNLYTHGNTATGGTLAGHPSILFSFEAVGSGGGQKAILNNDISQFQNLSSSILTYGTIVGTTVHIGASDATLGIEAVPNPSGDTTGLDSAATGSYHSAINSSGSSTDGPMIQIPTFGVPVAIAYNSSVTLTLKYPQLCGVLSGKITDWHTLINTVPSGTTIKVVYRSDSSGTTFLLSQYLDKVCSSSNSLFSTTALAKPTKYFITSGSNQGLLNTAPANFTGESGSAAVASQAVATANSLAYLSPDYTSIAPLSANTTSLKVAHLVNRNNNVSYTPTVSATETGLANPGTTGTNTTPPSPTNGGKTAAMDPQNWVPAIPDPSAGYPIVGYTTMDLSSCYAQKSAIGASINAFLVAQYTNAYYETIIKNNGFAPLVNTAASNYITAVKSTFLGNTYGYNLNIDNATTCASYAGR